MVLNFFFSETTQPFQRKYDWHVPYLVISTFENWQPIGNPRTTTLVDHSLALEPTGNKRVHKNRSAL